MDNYNRCAFRFYLEKILNIKKESNKFNKLIGKQNPANEVDINVKKAVDEVPMMKEYLRNRFALKNGDKPHLMKF